MKNNSRKSLPEKQAFLLSLFRVNIFAPATARPRTWRLLPALTKRAFHFYFMSKQPMETHVVDSFTKGPFKGNPAGVCFPKQELQRFSGWCTWRGRGTSPPAPLQKRGEPDDQYSNRRTALDATAMLKIVQGFGLSETAFVWKTGSDGVYAIRYFSPKQKISLCGHATLAAAKVLFSNTPQTEIHIFIHEQVDLGITRQGEDITMLFPVYNTVAATVPATMLAALGLPTVVNTAFSPKNHIILLEIADDQQLAALRPDFSALLQSYTGINGMLVTAPSSTAAYDSHYRYFWPWAGTTKDLVTGGV